MRVSAGTGVCLFILVVTLAHSIYVIHRIQSIHGKPYFSFNNLIYIRGKEFPGPLSGQRLVPTFPQLSG